MESGVRGNRRLGQRGEPAVLRLGCLRKLSEIRGGHKTRKDVTRCCRIGHSAMGQFFGGYVREKVLARTLRFATRNRR